MSTTSPTRRRRWILATATLAGFGVGVVLLMLWLVGAFRPKVGAGGVEAAPRAVGTAPVVELEAVEVPREEHAVGSIQPVHRVEVASRLMARAVEVNVAAGTRVREGEVLVRLEDTDLRSRAAQADAGVAQAGAALDQARVEASRIQAAASRNAAAAIEVDRATNALKGAEAALVRAEQARDEARAVLEYATIRSPIAGTVVDKRINSGDMVSPGQVVVTMLDPDRMQLVASVPESLSRRLSVGHEVRVRVDAIEHACTGVVSEIVPESEGTSRSFQVKVTGPCPEGIYAGMFGRLAIPVEPERLLLVPRSAIRVVGQLELVDVVQGERRVRRAIRTGREIDGRVEVLSGLSAGERVVADAREGR